ncbi:hypothetical protein L6164_014957 [Bauhinia variegata]|uniref:Uncharacterized protein n=1 Tax=Bauhinia variegata TaxID=167791 RepID=A0ACB9NJ88_BAUVA|nr:hypothetical protein L6164_014957 [Bauhinia variegata]
MRTLLALPPDPEGVSSARVLSSRAFLLLMPSLIIRVKFMHNMASLPFLALAPLQIRTTPRSSLKGEKIKGKCWIFFTFHSSSFCRWNRIDDSTVLRGVNYASAAAEIVDAMF